MSKNAYEVWNPFRYLFFSLFINPATGTILIGILSALLWQNWDGSFWGEYLTYSIRPFLAVVLAVFQFMVIWLSVCSQMGMEAGGHQINQLQRDLSEANERVGRLDLRSRDAWTLQGFVLEHLGSKLSVRRRIKSGRGADDILRTVSVYGVQRIIDLLDEHGRFARMDDSEVKAVFEDLERELDKITERKSR